MRDEQSIEQEIRELFPVDCNGDLKSFTTKDVNGIAKMVKPVSEWFIAMKLHIEDIKLMDYLEGLAFWAVGRENIPYFFLKCFPFTA